MAIYLFTNNVSITVIPHQYKGDKMDKKGSYDFKLFESKEKKPKKYLRLADNMMNSKAWLKLSCFAIALYVTIKAKYNFTNENDLSFTYQEGYKLMAKATFTKALDELIDYGFIYIVRQGTLNKECTIFGLSSEWRFYDTSAFEVKHRVKRIKKIVVGSNRV